MCRFSRSVKLHLQTSRLCGSLTGSGPISFAFCRMGMRLSQNLCALRVPHTANGHFVTLF